MRAVDRACADASARATAAAPGARTSSSPTSPAPADPRPSPVEQLDAVGKEVHWQWELHSAPPGLIGPPMRGIAAAMAASALTGSASSKSNGTRSSSTWRELNGAPVGITK